MSTQITQGLDVDRWQGRVILSGGDSAAAVYRLSERLQVTRHRPSAQKPRWKIDQRLEMEVRRNVFRSAGWMVSAGMSRFSDRNPSIGAGSSALAPLPYDFPAVVGSEGLLFSPESDLQFWRLAAGGSYRVNDTFSGTLALGPVFERRGGSEYSGLGADAGFDGIWGAIAVRGEGRLDRLAGDYWYGSRLGFDGSYEFSELSRDHYNVSLSSDLQRETELNPGQFSERGDRSFRINNRLEVTPDSPWGFQWNSRLINRSTSHRSADAGYDDHSFDWVNEMRMELTGDSRHALIGGVDFQELQYNQTLSQGLRSQLGIRSVFDPRELDSLAVHARAIRYRYDTPDLKEQNDRDELRYVMGLEAGRELTSALGLRVMLQVDLSHTVYLFRSRSGENRWTRLFILGCELPWREGPVDNLAAFSVASNYTDYDYLPASDNLSRVYRTFRMEDTLRVQAAPRLGAEFALSLLVDDHGKLRWTEWLQQKSEEGYGLTTLLRGKYRWDDAELSLGWRWHRRENIQRGGRDDGKASQSVRSTGPVAGLAYPTEPASYQLKFEGSWLWFRDHYRGEYHLPDARLELVWRL